GFGQPLLPLQILWLELFIDLAASVAFEREPEEPGAMRRPPRRRDEPLLTYAILARIAAAGGFTAMAGLGILLIGSGTFDELRWVAYTALVIGQVVRAYANRSLTEPVRRLRPNLVLAVACLAVIAVQLLIPAVPALADAFRAHPLSAAEWLVVAVVALLPALLAEAIRTLRSGTAWIA
ncbi:MAG TPA: cation-translocating P-type ATPase C-terminal domain-containing protein, partial [Candidatus Limnocylindria bacterium]|nr:cation-translocating P-type ATPase C-terminal domain-containing protein [Candidatus Limnocylindria bacterium]